jgi:AsmA protein
MPGLARRKRLLAVAIAVVGGLVVLVVAQLVIGPSSRFRFASVVASARDTMVIASPVRLGAALPLVLDHGVVYASDIPTASSPVSSRMVVDGARLVVTPSEAGPHEADEPLAPILAALLGPGFNTLTVRRTDVAFSRNGRAGDLLANLSAEAARRKQGLSVKGKFTLLGQRVRFEATAGLPPSDAKAGQRIPLRLVVSGAGFNAVFDGRLDVDGGFVLSGPADVTISEPRRVMRWLGLPIGTGEGLASLRARGNIIWRDRNVEFQSISLVADGNEATGALAINFEGPRPAIDGTLDVKTLNLTPYIDLSTSDVSLTHRFEHHLPLARDIDIDMRLSASTVIVGRHKLAGVAVTIALKAGRLLADVAEMDWLGGTLGGQITLDLATMPTTLILKGRLQKVDISRVTSGLMGFTIGQGASTVSLDLTARGASPAEMLRSLSGRVGLSMTEGGRLAIDVRQLVEDKGARADGSALWTAATRGTTPLDKLDLKLTVHNGVIRSEMAELAAGPRRFAISGSYNLLSDVIDLSFRLQEQVQRARNGATARVHGPRTNPDVSHTPN